MKAQTIRIATIVALTSAGAVLAQAPTPVASGAQARVNVTAVRVLIRARAADGRFINDLRPDEVEVLEDGVPAEVLGVERLSVTPPAPAPAPAGTAPPERPSSPPRAVPARVALYLVPELSGGGDLSRLLGGARAQADRLLAIGPVTVVLANPEPKVIGESITGRAQLDRVLAEHLPPARPWVRTDEIRRRFLDDVGNMGSDIQAKLFRARMAILDERAALQAVLGRLVSWSRTQPKGTGFLFLGMDGFDWHLSEFYLRALEPSARETAGMGDFEQAQAELRPFDLDGDVEVAAAALAERGWSVVAFNNGGPAPFFPSGAGQSGYDDTGHRSQFLHDATGPGSFDLAVPQSRILYPSEPLKAIAATTGGMFLSGSKGQWPTAAFGDALDELGHSWLLTYRVDRPADGRPHPLEVRVDRPSVTLTAPREVFSGTPEGEAVLRAERALAGAERGGELRVTLTLTPEPSQAKGTSAARMQVTADLSDLRPALETLGGARLRVTVAVEITGRDPFITHDVVETPLDEGGSWTYEAPMQWQRGATRVAVVVEELATGIWGVAGADLPQPR